jgi:hypothetical protein
VRVLFIEFELTPPEFKVVEFDQFRKQSESNSFVLFPQKQKIIKIKIKIPA